MKFEIGYERVLTYTGVIELEAPSEDAVYKLFDKMEREGELDVVDEDLWDETVEITSIDHLCDEDTKE